MLDIYPGYTTNDMSRKAIELFDEVKRKDLLPRVHSETNVANDESSLTIYLLTIGAAARLYDLSLSESIIKHIPSSYLSHPHIQNALIDMWVSRFKSSSFNILFIIISSKIRAKLDA